jgi:hypothetical protein
MHTGHFDHVALTVENIRNVHLMVEALNDMLDNDNTDEPLPPHAFTAVLDAKPIKPKRPPGADLPYSRAVTRILIPCSRLIGQGCRRATRRV